MTKEQQIIIQEVIKVFNNFDVLENYNGKNNKRQWANQATTWLYPDEAIAIINTKEIDDIVKKLKKVIDEE